jgi:hypothetical protein
VWANPECGQVHVGFGMLYRALRAVICPLFPPAPAAFAGKTGADGCYFNGVMPVSASGTKRLELPSNSHCPGQDGRKTQMPDEDLKAVIKERVAAGEKAMADEEYRQAVDIFRDISQAYSEVATKDPDSPDLFCAGTAHYFGAKMFLAWYAAAQQEMAPSAELAKHADDVVKFSRNAIKAFRACGDATGLDVCYMLLIDGLLAFAKSQRDPAGIVRATNDLLEAIAEYRTAAPGGKNKPNLIKLLYLQATTAEQEGIRLLFREYNPLASQAYFKKCLGCYDAVRQLVEGYDDLIHQADESERRVRGMSFFGEGITLQERGAYAEAVSRMQQAEAELEQSTSPTDLAYGRWAKASQHYYAAMQSELQDDFAACVKEYKEADRGGAFPK